MNAIIEPGRVNLASPLLIGIICLVSCAGCGATARTREPLGVNESAARLGVVSDSQIEERVAYIEQAIDSSCEYGEWWWLGWTGFYSLGAVIEGTRAGVSDGGAKRADEIVSAVKATGGVARLLYAPLKAKEGADTIRAMPHASHEDRLRQLAAAEGRLEENADEAEGRYSWVRHLANVGINVGGALIVWQGFDDPSRAARSAGVGFAVGEAMIWSQPWQPTAQWDEYQRRFAHGSAQSQISWHFVPTLGGAGIVAQF